MLAAALISTPTYATNMGDIQRKEQQKLNAAKTSQAKIDGVADQTDKIFDQFQKLSKDVEGLKIYNAQLKQQIDDQNTQLGELDNAIEQATVIERQIAPLTKTHDRYAGTIYRPGFAIPPGRTQRTHSAC